MINLAQRIARRALRAFPLRPAASNPPIATEKFLLPQITLNELLGDEPTANVCIQWKQIHRPRDMVLPLAELLSISAMCRVLKPSNIFEIGTFTGETAWSMASNLPTTSRLYTLDLPPEEIPSHFQPYEAGAFFKGTPESSRIKQLFGWSTNFDFAPYCRSIDLVFIDGDHSYAGVTSDTRNALQIVRKGGIVVWDDYRYEPYHQDCSGVAECLHSLMHELPLFQLSGTRLALMKGI